MQPDSALAVLLQQVSDVVPRRRRRLVALAGPPASGKSTLAQELAAALPSARVVPMDGFHLDNRILATRGLSDRKGAPETFDVAGFAHLLTRLQSEDDVFYPIFDRTTDRAIAGAGHIGPDTETVVVEGNYLLLDAPHWRDLCGLFDVTAYLEVPEDVLRARLMQRWHEHGYTPQQAQAKVEGNDLPNTRQTAQALVRPDIVLTEAR